MKLQISFLTELNLTVGLWKHGPVVLRDFNQSQYKMYIYCLLEAVI